jgi:hypothetical protein
MGRRRLRIQLDPLWLSATLVGGRKRKLESRALAVIRSGPKPAAMDFDNCSTNRKSQAQTVFFTSDESVKDAFLVRKIDAAGSVEIILGGETAADPRHLTHSISNVERIAPLVGGTGFEDGLGIEDKDGVKTLLRFEALPEIPETTP